MKPVPGWLGHPAAVSVLLAGWEATARQGWVAAEMVGQPSGIVRRLLKDLASAALWTDLGWTAWATLLAFAAGASIALALGLAFVRWPALERALWPYLAAANALPRIALAPLFVMWFGLGLGSRVAVGASLTLFIVLAHVVAGGRSASPDHLQLCRSLGASRNALYVKVLLPSALPVIASGLRLGLVYAMLGVVGAEVLGSDRGVGRRLAYQGATFDIDGLLVTLGVLAAGAGAAARGAALLERRWRPPG